MHFKILLLGMEFLTDISSVINKLRGQNYISFHLILLDIGTNVLSKEDNLIDFHNQRLESPFVLLNKLYTC